MRVWFALMSILGGCMKHLLVFFITVFGLATAHATDGVDGVEWRLLGPAFSYHSSLNGAPIINTQATAEVTGCKSADGVPNVFYCDGPRVFLERGWSSSNPALGIERSAPSSPGSLNRDKLFATVVRDSYGASSLMVGAGRQWPVVSVGDFSLSAGISGGLWNRTVAIGDVERGRICYRFVDDPVYGNMCLPVPKKYDGMYTTKYYETVFKRVTVPFLLPFIEIKHDASGLGANIALAPRIKIGKYETVPTTTIMLQFTYLMSF